MINNLRLFFSNPQTRSIGILFGILSILLSSWLTRLPEIQEKLALSESELGYSLLGMSIGNLIILPLSAWLLLRTTLGKGNFISSIIYSVSFILPVFAFQFDLLFGAMLLFGVTSGYAQFMTNSAAASIEQQLKRKVMSTSHGMFSVGLMIGAASSSLIAGLGVKPEIHLTSLSILMIGLAALIRPALLTIPENPLSTTKLEWPSRPIWGLLLLAFGLMYSEGVVMDWSAVYLKNNLKSSAFYAGLGITGFSLLMTIGRFSGDLLAIRWKASKLIFFGGLIGALGLSIAALTDNPLIAILGFSILGLGYSVIAPMLFSAAARVDGVHPNTGIASVAAAVSLGILVSRPVCGLIGEYAGLSASIGLGALLTIIFTIGSRFVKID